MDESDESVESGSTLPGSTQPDDSALSTGSPIGVESPSAPTTVDAGAPPQGEPRPPWLTRRTLIFSTAGALGVAAAGLLVSEVYNAAKSTYIELTDKDFSDAEPFVTAKKEQKISGTKIALDTTLTLPSDLAALRAYEIPRNAVAVDMRSDTFLLTGAIDEIVAITDIRATDLRSEPVPEGTWVQFPTGGGGGTTRQTLRLDLASGDLITATGERFFDSDILEISTRNRMLLTILAESIADQCLSWILEIDYLSPDSKQFTAYLDRDAVLHQDLAAVPEDARFSLSSQSPQYAVIYAADAENQLSLQAGSTTPPSY